MGVFTRPDSKFWWIFLEGTRIRENTKILIDAPTAAERRDAKALAESSYRAKMGDRARQRYDLPSATPAITFSAFIDWYQAHVLPTHRGAEREREILPRIRAVFGKHELAAIDRHLVTEQWITPRLAQKPRVVNGRTIPSPGPRTINREVDVLKGILQAAVPKYLKVSPLFGMKRLRTHTPKRRLMSEDEEQRLLAVMAPDDRALFLIGLDALVRLHDILDVKRTDDQGDRMWIADPKAGGGFAVPLSARARKAIDALPASSSPYLFPRRRRAQTERDRRNGIRQMLERYCLAASVPYGRAQGGITFHWATRRTGATRMLTRGIDPGTVQKVGRWKKPDVVLSIYHELIDDQARAAVETVGRRPGKRRGRTVDGDRGKPGYSRGKSGAAVRRKSGERSKNS